MRKIKFKAWLKTESRWLEDVEFYLDAFGRVFTTQYSGLGEPYTDITDIVAVVQFTGLHDKNGEEIYEGYVVQKISWVTQDTRKAEKLYKVGDKVKAYDEKEYTIVEIEPNSNKGYEYINLCKIWIDDYEKVEFNPKYGFLPFADSPENCGCCGRGEDPTECRVVGNIYENPELLK